MSTERQRLLGRAFCAAVLASLTFGGSQALAGVPPASCENGTCTTRPYDEECAARCLRLYPENGGAHGCIGAPRSTEYCCVCTA